MNFGFGDNNCCLWILIILLILCVCKNGGICNILNSCYALPIALALICCLCKNGGGNLFGFGNGCCK
ncbi:MAG: chorion class high-cysteine HCB protein 13 [Clostridia bacterium]|nr:chorion class high-cysteine HCB protein 13 [Clostridia bacterium]